MADIVVTEFLDPGPIELLKQKYSVHVDTDLWNKRSELEKLVGDAIALIVRNRTRVDAALLDEAPKLKVIGRLGVGLDNIDMEACKARNIVVCPAVGANAVAVAEHVIATTLILLRRAAYLSTSRVAAGEWPREELSRGHEAAGRRFGIIGYGSIGQQVGARARALGMHIVAYDRYLPPDSPAWENAERASLDEVLEICDVVTLHCPLTPETRGLIGARELARMKKGAILINTARGGIVDEQALADALRSGHLGGAAIDVFSTEPIDESTAAIFRNVPNLILTPHIAGVTIESNARISTVTVDNVLRELKAAGL
ncbi:MAG: hydroxyacid dehydrogenase [Pseudomonadota bacterium]